MLFLKSLIFKYLVEYLNMSINYIIASYSGKINNRIKHDSKLAEECLDLQMESISKVLLYKKRNGIKNHISQITIVCPPCSDPLPRYYQKEKWNDMFKNIVNIVYLNYEGENKHASYDQYLQAMIKFPEFKYSLIIEDDYYIDPNNYYFDEELIKIHQEKFKNGDGYLSTFSPNYEPWLPLHAAISNGIINTSSILKLKDKLKSYCPSSTYFVDEKCYIDIEKTTTFEIILKTFYNYVGHPQRTFSYLFLDNGIQIDDMINEYSAYYYESNSNAMYNFSSIKNKNIFLPVQMLNSTDKIIHDCDHKPIYKINSTQLSMSTKNIVITGGCGFIGHHFVEHILKNTNWNIVVIDKLSYASFGLRRLKEIGAVDNKRVKIFTFDLCNSISDCMINEIGDVNYIVHMAADTHVDNSISDPVPFVNNNILSTLNLLEYARKLKSLEIFFYFSTDEVYGPAINKLFTEDDRHNPTNPYSASKSSAEQLCIAYMNTYKLPLISVNVMNAFGERQHVEKFIPKVINNILTNKKTYIHSYPDKKKSGSRFYIHARNIAQAVLFLINKGKIGEAYNITGEAEISNLDLALFIAKTMNKELDYEMVDFHSDRPGHDLRYGLDGSKMEQMGWKLPIDFYDSLKKTIIWTLENKEWLQP